METTGNALIVGAGGGIGSEIALAFVANGASAIFCADINIEAARKTQAACEVLSPSMTSGPSVRAFAAYVDVTNEDSVNKVVDEAHRMLDRIDYFVNASGFGNPGQISIESTSFDDYKAMDSVHNHGTFLLLKAVLSKMNSQDLVPRGAAGRSDLSHPRFMTRGTICVLASLASAGGFLGVGPYVSAKHAVVGLVKNAAIENASKKIRINAVSPSYVSGPMMDQLLQEATSIRDDMMSDLPLGRLADPTEVADTVVFLCSASSSYINGHNMIVDGGASVSLAKGKF